MKERITHMARFACLSAVASLALMAVGSTAAHAQDFVLYGGTATGAIYEVDPVAKTSAEVANFGRSINGLAWVPTTERLYFAETITNPGDGGLYYWDRATNTFSTELLSASNLLGEMDNGSYYDGAIWYVDGNGLSDTMYRLDLTTLAITPFANFDGTSRTDFDFGDMVVTLDGQAYGYATDRDRGVNTFFQIDLSSGAPFSSSYSEVDVTGNYQLGINLDDSVMYGTGGINVGTGNWFVVNPTTGEGSDIPGFTTPTFSDVSGRGALPVATAAPEPGSIGLLAIGALPFMGMVIRRKRV